MQPEKIVLIPPTHEISTPSFHVVEELLESFVNSLKESGIQISQPPVPLSEKDGLWDVRVEADTPVSRLEDLMHRFMERHGSPNEAA